MGRRVAWLPNLAERATLPGSASLTLAEFGASAEAGIAREHAAAKANGILFPEIFWPAVACEAWPALASLDLGALDDFLFEHAQLKRTVRLMPGAADALRGFSASQHFLGLVSNSQPYTLRELDAALAAAGLSRALFPPDLCFFSFEHGFSKPDHQWDERRHRRLAGNPRDGEGRVTEESTLARQISLLDQCA